MAGLLLPAPGETRPELRRAVQRGDVGDGAGDGRWSGVPMPRSAVSAASSVCDGACGGRRSRGGVPSLAGRALPSLRVMFLAVAAGLGRAPSRCWLVTSSLPPDLAGVAVRPLGGGLLASPSQGRGVPEPGPVRPDPDLPRWERWWQLRLAGGGYASKVDHRQVQPCRGGFR